MVDKLRIRIVIASAAAVLLGGCGRSTQSPVQPADTLLSNAYVYTADAAHTRAEAVAIRDGRIVFVGNNDDVGKFQGPDTDVRDLGGRMLMPGLHDMHIHAMGTVQPDMCDFRGEAKSLEQMVPFLQACITRYGTGEGEWLIVQQWPFSSGNEPSDGLPSIRAALDAVSDKHPIMLLGDDGHHAAANSLALAMARDQAGKVLVFRPPALMRVLRSTAA